MAGVNEQAPTGSDLQVSARFERGHFAPGDEFSIFRAMKGVSGHVAKRPRERNENQNPAGQTIGGVNARADIQPKFDYQPDVESIVPFRAHHCGMFAFGAALAAGVHPLTLTPKEPGDEAPDYVDSMGFEISDGDGYPVALYEAAMQDFQLSFTDGKITGVTENWMACLDTYVSDAEEVSVDTFTGKPSIFGHFASSVLGNLPLRIRASSVAGEGYDGKVRCAMFKAGAGTITTDADTTIIGVDTAFLGYSIGDSILISGETEKTITAIADDTHMTLSAALVTTSVGHTYKVAHYGASFTLGAGTITTDADATVLGVGTTFTDYAVGDVIHIEGEAEKTIAAIADATHMTLSSACVTTLAGLVFRVAHPTAATSTSITFDQPFRIVLGDGSRIGISRFDDMWGILPSGSGALAVGDEWGFTTPRTLADPTYSDLQVLTSAGLEIIIDGKPYGATPGRPGVHTGTIKLTRPRKQNFTNGSKYAQGIQRNGRWTATIDLDRDRDNRDFLDALIQARSIAINVSMYGNPIGDTGFDEFWGFSFPNCEVSDTTRDVATENTLPEKISINAVRGADGTPIFTETIIGPVSELPGLPA
jgi:hypothetical protein